MLPERTTTMGEEESVATERPFHSMKAVERTRAKLRIWAASCRGCMPARAESMVVVLFVVWWVVVWDVVWVGVVVS